MAVEVLDSSVVLGAMEYLHTMIRVLDLDKALHFFCEGLGLKVIRRKDYEAGRFSLIFLAAEAGAPEVELTYNWDQKEPYTGGRNFGHLAFRVKHIYEVCEHLERLGYPVLRPPRDGHMAFVRSPDQISIELLQAGEALPPQEPWASRANQGEW